MGDVIELQPPYVLSDAQREAIQRARFKTVNVGRTWAIVYDSDRDLMAATGLDFAAYERVRGSGVYDHEARSYEPAVVEFVATLDAKPTRREDAPNGRMA